MIPQNHAWGPTGSVPMTGRLSGPVDGQVPRLTPAAVLVRVGSGSATNEMIPLPAAIRPAVATLVANGLQFIVMLPSMSAPAVSDQRPGGVPPDGAPPATADQAVVTGDSSGPPTVPWQFAFPFTAPEAKPLAVYCGNVPTA